MLNLIPWVSLVLVGSSLVGQAAEIGGWRGPNGSGAISSGLSLVEDIAQAKLVWKSEETPGVYGGDIQTGQSGPVVADGKVFLVYHEPNDTVGDDEFIGRVLGSTKWPKGGGWSSSSLAKKAAEGDAKAREQWARKKFAIAADDVMQCFDAKTGKTLWKTVFAGKGINNNKQGRGEFISAKCAPHITPCYAKGKVYAFGSTGRVYCVDAATGKLVWESDLGATFQKLEALKEQARKDKKLPAYGGKTMATGPVFADGVVVAYDDAGGLIGFDPQSGQKLWTAKVGGGQYYSSPIRWVHDGKEYVVTSGTCVEPRTGKVLWQVQPPTMKEPGTASVAGDFLIWQGVCFRISPEKATELWKFPEESPSFRDATPILQNGLALFRSQNKQTVVAIELATGKVVATAEKVPGVSTENGSFCGGDGRAFLELGRDAGSMIGMFHMDAKTTDLKPTTLAVPNYAMSSTPYYANGFLYLRMQNHLACYDVRK